MTRCGQTRHPEEELLKALLASALTALVLVTTAWASNVTPAQLNALSKRVKFLEQANVRQTDVLNCLRAGWNAQSATAYAVATYGGYDTKTGNLSMIVAPSAADGIAGTGYLVTSPAPASAANAC
jgi:hypothetical protein